MRIEVIAQVKQGQHDRADQEHHQDLQEGQDKYRQHLT
jgi:hypothetical protein